MTALYDFLRPAPIPCTQESHALLKAPAIWPTLPHLQIQTWPWGEVIEMRDCPHCGSTLAVVVKEGEPEKEEPEDEEEPK